MDTTLSKSLSWLSIILKSGTCEAKLGSEGLLTKDFVKSGFSVNCCEVFEKLDYLLISWEFLVK